MKKENTSVAPESKEVKEKIICGQTCDCQSGDDCSFGSIDRANWNLDPIKSTPAIDGVVSVKNLTELSLTHAIEACKNIHNPAKREASILSSAHDYRTGYTTALSVNKQPEKEVDTIEQAAGNNDYLNLKIIKADSYNNGYLDGFKNGSKPKDIVSQDVVFETIYESADNYCTSLGLSKTGGGYSSFIAGAKNYKSTHIPFDKAIKAIYEFRNTNRGDSALLDLIEQIKSLIKPQ